MPQEHEPVRPGRGQKKAKSVNYLIIANVIVYLLTLYYGPVFYDILGLHHPKSSLFEPHQLISHIFMHGGYFHIFINMFILWMFGTALELIWGARRFLVYYFLTGLGAAALHLAVTTYSLERLEREARQFIESPSYEGFIDFKEEYIDGLPPRFENEADNLLFKWESAGEESGYSHEAVELIQKHVQTNIDKPTVGASGAIYGLLMAFGMLFPNVYIYLYFLFPIKAKYFVILLGIIELYSGLFGQNVSIANFAHLGGMLFGFILLKIWGDKAKPKSAQETYAEVVE